jgi:hypothetical protein
MGFRWDEKRKKYVETSRPKRKKSTSVVVTDYVGDAVKSYFQSYILKSEKTMEELAQAVAEHQQRKMAKEGTQWFIDEGVSKAKENKKKAVELSKKLKGIQKEIFSPLKSAISSSKNKAAQIYKLEEKLGSLGSLGSYKMYAGAEIAESALNFATQSARFAYNRYITLNEDYITKQAVTNAMDSINRVKNMGSSVINGIATGASTGGVVGAVIGGVTSAIDFGVNQYFEYQQKMSSYYQQLNATNFQTNFDASRLGLIGSSGTEN